MLKLSNVSIGIGTTITLKDEWRKAINNLLKPHNKECLTVFNIINKENNNYVCRSPYDKNNIIVTSAVAQYLLGDVVRNSNVGVYFDDYLPDENERILIWDKFTCSVYPAKVVLSIKLLENEVPFLDFSMVDLLTFGRKSINNYLTFSWKVLSGSEEYMNNSERMYKDTFIHKEYVFNTCNLFAKYLENNGQKEDAKQLRNRAIVHDNSKIINKDEFEALRSIVNDKYEMKNADAQLSEHKQNFIKLHWQHNTHHPEHFENVEDMSKIDRMEMVCDWYARAKQYNTQFLEFVKKRQEDRFHFPDDMFKEIMEYCEIIYNLDKN